MNSITGTGYAAFSDPYVYAEYSADPICEPRTVHMIEQAANYAMRQGDHNAVIVLAWRCICDMQETLPLIQDARDAGQAQEIDALETRISELETECDDLQQQLKTEENEHSRLAYKYGAIVEMLNRMTKLTNDGVIEDYDITLL